MKTIPADLLAHYATGCTTLARLWKVTRRDGQVYGFTDHDAELVFSGVTYAPSSAFDASAVSTRAELNVDNLELVGLVQSAGITAEDIEAGRWDGASVELRQVNWADLTDGAEVMRVGQIGQIERRGGRYVAELRGLMQALQNNVGRSIAPTCDAKLGDTRCGVDLDALAVAAAITTLTTQRLFTASALTDPAGYYTGGQVTMTSGLANGLAMEVKDHDTGGVITLALPMPIALTVGDTFSIVPGCDKTKTTCKDVYANIVNFRGFSFVPGNDRTMLIGGQ